MGFKNGADFSGDSNQFNVAYLRAGDIIFFNSTSSHFWPRLKQNVNVIGQRLLAAIRPSKHRISIFDRIPKYSHVILGLDGGIIIHADGKSVEIEVISDALHLDTTEQADYSIYRYKGTSDEACQKISSEAIRYYNQKYSFSPYFRKISVSSDKPTSNSEDTTQFCSRLVAYSYRAAGVELTDLPDHKVLPIDLFRICSLSPWEDITQEFIDSDIDISNDIDGILRSITMPNGEEMTVSYLNKFMKEANAVFNEGAALFVEIEKKIYKRTKNMLIYETNLAIKNNAQLKLAQLVRNKPGEINEFVADHICEALEQIDTLLALSIISDRKLITPDIFSKLSANGIDCGAYVNFPSIKTMHELQLNREETLIYACLLFAETGIFTILAHIFTIFDHYEPNDKYRIDKYKMFEVVSRSTANRFLTSISRGGDLSVYDNPQELFVWIEDDRDRYTIQQILENIVAGLRVIRILRSTSGIDETGPVLDDLDTLCSKHFDTPNLLNLTQF